MEIYCPDALSINLLYDKFWLPDGAKLFVYSADKRQAIGAFTSANNKGTKEELRGFATDLIYSDDIFIEYYVPKGITDIGMISIAYIIHGYTYVLSRENYEITSNQCQVNINCLEGMNWQNEKNAVVKIIVGEKTGSGFLINTTANDNRPYLLTADHKTESKCGSHNNKHDFLKVLFHLLKILLVSEIFDNCKFTTKNITAKLFRKKLLKHRNTRDGNFDTVERQTS